MDMLASCLCGHALTQHDAEGCDGERLRPCSCRRDRAAVNDRASRLAGAGSDRAFVPTAQDAA